MRAHVSIVLPPNLTLDDAIREAVAASRRLDMSVTFTYNDRPLFIDCRMDPAALDVILRDIKRRNFVLKSLTPKAGIPWPDPGASPPQPPPQSPVAGDGESSRSDAEKLVRDRIPEIIAADTGKAPEFRVDHDPAWLARKIVEEAGEVSAAIMSRELSPDPARQIAAELADVMTVIYEIMDEFGISYATIDDILGKKRDEKGGFHQRKIMKEG